MFSSKRDTAATPPVVDAAPPPLSPSTGYGRQVESLWYQNAPCTEPSMPIHQISMLSGTRDTAAMPLDAEAGSSPFTASW